mmetsp:Transcript_2928/g.4286  ORF Transcript_2928/g.4286 Transcript_2928/m.4286 type:complete len:121 (-) Transcript_2928:226-588(-)
MSAAEVPILSTPSSKFGGRNQKEYNETREANDPVAMRQMGTMRRSEGDYDGAFEYWSKAAGLGDVGAHYQLSVVYREGLGAEKDKKKELHHLEEAAIGGHTFARHNLGIMEGKNGRPDGR